MEYKYQSMKTKAIFSLVGAIIFYAIAIVFSEAAKRVGGLNLGYIISGMSFFVAFACTVTCAYNAVRYSTRAAYESDKKDNTRIDNKKLIDDIKSGKPVTFIDPKGDTNGEALDILKKLGYEDIRINPSSGGTFNPFEINKTLSLEELEIKIQEVYDIHSQVSSEIRIEDIIGKIYEVNKLELSDTDKNTLLCKMKRYEANKLIGKSYKELNEFFRSYRKSSDFMQNGNVGEKILNESVHILKNLAERPLEFLGLTAITCDKCGKVSFIFKEDLKDVEKVGDNFPNHYCSFCGKQLIENK